MANPTVIGLTGPACSGKSTVAHILAGFGWHVIDADTVGHEILAGPEVCRKVVGEFGHDILSADGCIDRRKLGGIVFSAPERLHDLEAILHPLMLASIADRIGKLGNNTSTVIDAAVLFRIGLHRLCQMITWVEADWDSRLARAKKRGWNEAELHRRDEASGLLTIKSDFMKYHQNVLFVDNSGTQKELLMAIRSNLTGLN